MEHRGRDEMDSMCSYLPSLLAKKKKKKYNKGEGWRCGLPRLVSTFLVDNKACLCLDEPLWALSFHNPRPHSLCFSDPLCQWIKIWAERMDSAFQHNFHQKQTRTKDLWGNQKKERKYLFHLWLITNVFLLRSRDSPNEKNYPFTRQTATFSYGTLPSKYPTRKITAFGAKAALTLK